MASVLAGRSLGWSTGIGWRGGETGVDEDQGWGD
jgi:hypothetical protein